MNEERNIEKDEDAIVKRRKIGGYTAFIVLFVALFLFVAIITLLKYITIYPDGYSKRAILSFIGSAAVLILLLFVYAIYCFLTRSRLMRKPKELAVICTCMALSYGVCIFCEAVSAYLMPIFLTAFLLAPLSKRKDAFMANLFCVLMVLSVLLIEYTMLKESIDILPVLVICVVGLFSGSLVAFVLSYERKRLDFLVKSLAICVGSILLTITMSYLARHFAVDRQNILLDLMDSGKWAVLSAFSQLILSILLQPLFERIFNLLTNSRLIELMDHNSPLIRKLFKDAPGTFNHSLAVANFAEICATAIGENPYLARASAYYHDIGKLSNPAFFKENQHDQNPHDNILPEVSVEIIRGHTADGYKLCKEYHIPEEIAKVTVEHHGTMAIPMFYYKAQELTDSDVDIKDYSYKGSVPTTKIAAIIMICDSAEAALRAMDSSDINKTEKLLNKLIWGRLQNGQFEDCDITLRELSIIQSTIAGSYGGVFHKRIKYPDGH